MITTAELLAMVTETIDRQIATTRAGKELSAHDAAAVASLAGNIARNVTARIAAELEIEE